MSLAAAAAPTNEAERVGSAWGAEREMLLLAARAAGVGCMRIYTGDTVVHGGLPVLRRWWRAVEEIDCGGQRATCLGAEEGCGVMG